MVRTLTPCVVATALALAKLGGAAEGENPGEGERRARAPAHGSCSSAAAPGLFDGPVTLGFFAADFGTARRACPRNEVGAGFLAGAIIDTPDFYGALSGGALVYGSLALSPELEVFGALEAVKVQYVQNASLKATSVALGHSTIGATYALLRRGGLLLSPSARVMLPTDFSTPDVRTVGLQVGGSVSLQLTAGLSLNGYLGGDLSLGLSAASPLPRAGFLASAGVQYAFIPWLGVALDFHGRVGGASYLAPALALRASLGDAMGLELGGTLPVWGTIRNDGALGLKIAYRL